MKKITWAESKTIPLALTGSVYVRKMSGGYYESPPEFELDQIAAWVKETGVGRRTSFDTFKFRNHADMSMFLLRWKDYED